MMTTLMRMVMTTVMMTTLMRMVMTTVTMKLTIATTMQK